MPDRKREPSGSDTPERLREKASRARYHSLMVIDRETGRRLRELAEELEAAAERLEAGPG